MQTRRHRQSKDRGHRQRESRVPKWLCQSIKAHAEKSFHPNCYFPLKAIYGFFATDVSDSRSGNRTSGPVW